jgi:hypothetical protein
MRDVMEFTHLDDHIEQMRKLGEFLIPYNFPQVQEKEESDINNIKSKEVCVDGYNLIVHYSKADWGNHYLETLQILGKYMPFLPFSLVCKIGKRFLGDKHLSLVEIVRENRKIYCWSVVLNRSNEPIQGPYQGSLEHNEYDGLEFHRMTSDNVNFY